MKLHQFCLPGRILEADFDLEIAVVLQNLCGTCLVMPSLEDVGRPYDGGIYHHGNRLLIIVCRTDVGGNGVDESIDIVHIGSVVRNDGKENA